MRWFTYRVRRGKEQLVSIGRSGGENPATTTTTSDRAVSLAFIRAVERSVDTPCTKIKFLGIYGWSSSYFWTPLLELLSLYFGSSEWLFVFGTDLAPELGLAVANASFFVVMTFFDLLVRLQGSAAASAQCTH